MGCRFKELFKLAEIVFVLLHSNADWERLFGIVRKNKTDSRSRLKLDGTLSSILTLKSRYPESNTPCFKWKPDDNILGRAKSATVKSVECKYVKIVSIKAAKNHVKTLVRVYIIKHS